MNSGAQSISPSSQVPFTLILQFVVLNPRSDRFFSHGRQSYFPVPVGFVFRMWFESDNCDVAFPRSITPEDPACFRSVIFQIRFPNLLTITGCQGRYFMGVEPRVPGIIGKKSHGFPHSSAQFFLFLCCGSVLMPFYRLFQSSSISGTPRCISNMVYSSNSDRSSAGETFPFFIFSTALSIIFSVFADTSNGVVSTLGSRIIL